MHDQPWCRISLNDGHLQCRAHQPSRHRRAHRPAHNLARVQVQHCRQIQPAAARTDVGDVADPGLIGQGLIELPVEHIARHSHGVFAICGVDKLAPPNRPQAIEPHQNTHSMATHGQTTLGHGSPQSAAAIRLVACCKGGFEVHTGSTHHRLNQTLPVRCHACVVAGAANFEDTARLANSHFGACLLLQVFNQLVAHLSSRAKKADAFFNISTSPRSCRFSCSN